MAWLTLINALFLPGKPILGSTGIALRDNIEAGHRAAAGAPIGINAGWHPYDRTVIGGTETGLIYDFGVHGAVSAIDTPDFEDGFEYAILGRGLSFDSGINRTLQVQLYRATGAAWSTAWTSTVTLDGTTVGDLWVEIIAPRVVKTVHPIRYELYASVGGGEGGRAVVYNATAQKIGKGRVAPTSGQTDGGQVYLFRRGMQS
jgi:hypothetical protein